VNEILGAFGWSSLAVIGFMTVLWLVSLPLRNSSIVDIFWGPTFLLQAIVYAFVTPDAGSDARSILIVALVAAWSIRLALHIGSRNIGKGEDYRYAGWREEAGASWWWRSFFRVFVLQGVLSLFIGLPLLAAQVAGPAQLGWLDAVGAAVWGIGFFFEAVGDWQLTQFLRNPANRGHTMRSGLWQFTRHPNYFGDATQWWGLWLIALAAGGWWTLLSPVAMTFLIYRISGVGMLEATIAERRPDYADYMRTTNAFIPWLPKTAKETDR